MGRRRVCEQEGPRHARGVRGMTTGGTGQEDERKEETAKKNKNGRPMARPSVEGRRERHTRVVRATRRQRKADRMKEEERKKETEMKGEKEGEGKRVEERTMSECSRCRPRAA